MEAFVACFLHSVEFKQYIEQLSSVRHEKRGYNKSLKVRSSLCSARGAKQLELRAHLGLLLAGITKGVSFLGEGGLIQERHKSL